MTKAPHLPVLKPGEGGASSRRCTQPRNAKGVFIKRSDAVAAPAKPKPKPKQTRTPTPAQLIARMSRAVEHELNEIEAIIGKRGAKKSDAEKRARTLASLARTLAEVKRLRESQNEAKRDDDDSAVPHDLCELRETLERRLAQLVDPAAVRADRESDAP